MPPPAHLKVIYSGTFGAQAAEAEIWSFGLSLGLGAGGADPQAFINKESLTAAVESFKAAQDGFLAGATEPVVLRRTRLVYIGSDGLTPKGGDGAYIQADSSTVSAAAGLRVFPNQVALAYTLETNSAGAVGRGRFYLPLPVAGGLEADGRMSDAVRDAHVTRGKTLVDNLNAASAAAGFGRVSVASGGSALKGILPALYPVERVGVGRVLDTIRSRRGALPEARESLAVAA